MNKPHIIAVGSSPFIAHEVAQMCQSILGKNQAIKTCTTNEVKNAHTHTLYVCATTQSKELSNIIPSNQLFVFDLRPTTPFFFEIAKIPIHEPIYVFNNLLPYTKQLQTDCSEILHISADRFIPIAYEEMPYELVCQTLQKANYIIGVDQFVDTNVLLSPRFKSYLKENVTIIAGKRTPSIQSASQLLIGYLDFYLADLDSESTSLTVTTIDKDNCSKITSFDKPKDSVYKQENTHMKLQELLTTIHQGIERIVTNQFQPHSQVPLRTPISDTLSNEELIDELQTLKQKLVQLYQP